MICPKCTSDNAHRSHRRNLKERLASIVGLYPFRCRACGQRFLQFAPAADAQESLPVVAEIRSTRSALRWKHQRREFLLFGAGIIAFVLFLYWISRERTSSDTS